MHYAKEQMNFITPSTNSKDSTTPSQQLLTTTQLKITWRATLMMLKSIKKVLFTLFLLVLAAFFWSEDQQKIQNRQLFDLILGISWVTYH